MSEQVNAPPTEEQHEAIVEYRRQNGPTELLSWLGIRGWCSCCKAQPVRVAHMGHERFNFALCAECVAKLADVLDDGGSDSGSTGDQ